MAAGRPAAFACRQGDPAAAPLNSRGRATMPPGPLASADARQARSSSGGERSPHSQHRCKVSRSRGDSGKDRPRHDASAARVHAAEILIRAQRPPAAPSVNISLRVLAYGAVSATGWEPHRCSECFGSVKLRRRSIKSATNQWDIHRFSKRSRRTSPSCWS